MTRINSRLVLVPLLMGALLGACSRTDILAGPKPAAREGLEITPPTATVELGRSIQLEARRKGDDTLLTPDDVEWSVEPEDAGTVTPQGIFTALAEFPGADDNELAATVRARLKDESGTTGTSKITIVPRLSGPPTLLEKISGDLQRVPAGEPLGEPLVVHALDADGAGVAGLLIRFARDGSDGAIDAVTDADGVAQATIDAPTLAGEHLVRVSAPGEALEPVVFVVTIESGPLARMTASHSNPSGVAGAVVPEPVALGFFDAFDNPVAGMNAALVEPSGAAVVRVDDVSNAQGIQRMRVKLPIEPGLHELVFRSVESPEISTSIEFLVSGGDAARLEIASGDGQSGQVDHELAEALVVRVLDANGVPAANGTLQWSLPDGGTLLEAETTPATDGSARARLRLPTTAGLVRVVVDAGQLLGSPATFTVRARPGQAQRLMLVSGDAQTTTAGESFPAAFTVRTTDGFSNGVAGVTVRFESVEGGGAVLPAQVESGPDGTAQTQLVAGAAGRHRYRAVVDGLVGSPIEISGTAVNTSPQLRLELVSGQAQSGSVLSDLPQPLIVRVMRGLLPEAGRTVTFAVLEGDGSVRPTQATTVLDGTAGTTARLGSRPGPHRFSASLPGAANSPIIFEAIATGARVAVLRAVSGGGQAGLPGDVLAEPLVVEALADDGQPVAGAQITFAPPAGGQVTPTTATTDAEGRASTTARLGPALGEQLFTATALGGASAQFRAVADPNAGGLVLHLISGDGQSAEAGSDLAQPLRVRVTTNAGAPRAGIEVRFRAEEAGAKVSPPSALTDANGYAETRARLGGATGQQRFQAEVTDATNSPATFIATATAPGAERIVIVSGDGQSAPAGRTLAKPLVVRAVDSLGNGVAGVSVQFRAALGGGGVQTSSTVTNAQGEASTAATLGPAPGPQTFEASAPGIPSSVTFTATATPAVRSVSVSPQGRTLEVGASQRYTATAIFTDGSSADVTQSATWASTASAIASVDNADGGRGIVRALAAGTTNIRATYEGVTGETGLTVRAATLRSVVIVPAAPVVGIGGTIRLQALGTFSNDSVADVTDTGLWESMQPAIAATSNAPGAKGSVRGVSKGTAGLRFSLNGVVAWRDVLVTDAPLRQLEVTPANVTQPAGSTVSFRATATYDDGSVVDVTDSAQWSSSDTALMTVQNAPAQAGTATLLAAGTPEVRATYAGSTASQRVNITDARVLSISIQPSSFEMAVGDVFQLRLTARYSDGTLADATEQASWSTAAATIADVSNAPGSRGLVTGISRGTTQITASLGGQQASMRMQINGSRVREIEIIGGGRNPTCPAGGYIQLAAQAVYAGDGWPQPVNITDQASWSSSDTSIAIVGQGAQGGRVQCLRPGTVTITAAYEGAEDDQSVRVTDARLSRISIAPNGAQLAVGAIQPFVATGHYSDGSERDITSLVTWSASNPAVLAVSNAAGNRGVATALSAGTTQVVASLDGTTASVTVTVSGKALQAIIISPANPIVNQWQQVHQFSATALYDDGTTQDVTRQVVWTSSNPSVASVVTDSNFAGWVRLNSRGTCTIAASFSGKQGSTTLTVR